VTIILIDFLISS